ncbi:MetQ/NlpA family ABC transporter substrate-binding protein [Aquibaculum arenosum]|uniref:Lipoprotein n=1 Tax=Aquibaculum arenosum TaxID=3032591 RepID=A0ABT5YPT9_9PROT|nr:MetQ/NlpA family ABC transporter substrate-binding protein [Fodinicurvata sp. CAU 1616]MDF2096745.1 MetQ/NlpA family ABC transporter substrate-binding protein [Fodinicurvata sp. CAU 1616]
MAFFSVSVSLTRLLSGASFVAAGFATALVFSSPAAAESLRVGVSAGPYGQVLDEAARLAAEQGLDVEIIEFTEWTMINEALHNGDIDANNFQHKPYLDNQIAARGYEIVPLDSSIVVPMALYSESADTIEELPEGASIGIPNDPTNAARALFLLGEAGLLTLAEGAGATATILDVAENPRDLRFVELDAAQLPRSLSDLDASVITLNYAVVSGLDPHDSLIIESEESDWTLVWAVREDRAEDPTIRRFIDIYSSEEVREFIDVTFEGTILPTW